MTLTFETLAFDHVHDVTVLAVTGEIDVATAPQLHDHLDTLPDRDTVLDVSGVTLLGAAGLRVLLGLHHRLDRADARLVLAALAPGPLRALAAAGVDTELVTARTVTHAVVLILTEPPRMRRHTPDPRPTPQPRQCPDRKRRPARPSRPQG